MAGAKTVRGILVINGNLRVEGSLVRVEDDDHELNGQEIYIAYASSNFKPKDGMLVAFQCIERQIDGYTQYVAIDPQPTE